MKNKWEQQNQVVHLILSTVEERQKKLTTRSKGTKGSSAKAIKKNVRDQPPPHPILHKDISLAYVCNEHILPN